MSIDNRSTDALVVFGISGDLARLQTFRSLYRLGRRGLLEIELDMEFADEGGEAPTPYEVLLHAALVGDSTYFTRQDSVEATWRIVQPLLDRAPPVHGYGVGSWGPSEAQKLVAGFGGWHGPWVAP
jgi:glucose-6-phosphate 1-dehydrogenase